jgi:hypothetical protein
VSVSKKVAALRTKTTARGCTEAEAAAAAAKISELQSDQKREAARGYLVRHGRWTEAQAAGIVDHLDLHTSHNVAGWRGRRLAMMYDWCSCNNRKASSLSGQLDFITNEMRGVFYQSIPLINATTADEASKLVAPYFEFIKKGN